MNRACTTLFIQCAHLKELNSLFINCLVGWVEPSPKICTLVPPGFFLKISSNQPHMSIPPRWWDAHASLPCKQSKVDYSSLGNMVFINITRSEFRFKQILSWLCFSTKEPFYQNCMYKILDHNRFVVKASIVNLSTINYYSPEGSRES